MKLEVGMYVRGFRGINKIIKIEPYNDTFLYYTDGKEGEPFYFERHIKRPSFNPIDLIEVGDYVNGSRVVYFMIDEEKSINEGIDEKIGVVVEEEWEGKKYLTKDIKSILTKEQFKSMEYEVK